MKYLRTKKFTLLSAILKYSFVFVIAFSIAMPFVCVQAETTGIVVTNTIKNPLGENLKDIPSFIKKMIEIVLTIGIPILVLALIYTGFLFVKAQGNSKALDEAKQTLANVLIGGALLLGAFVIAEAIGKTVDEIKTSVDSSV